MTTAQTALQNLHRPRLLIRAARFGLAEYNRDRDLKRLMKTTTTPGPAKALDALLAVEAELENTRETGQAAYSVARHIEVLIALMAESRALATPPDST
ncbi:MAG TPA: hypothetical protein ENK28_05570 [Aliiroseovarius sp.]|nr:hypothetical protein [Aliiroseovarius sp.]